GRLSLRAEIAGQTSADSQNPSVIVSIRDTGEGIPQDRISRLFDPYYSTKPTGTGLGLTVVHRVIQEHRGRIRVDSTPGRGATFTVELPLLEAGR
ncbi:MAG: sensor histidine kinase, partial [Acidobacteria bacterium]|nr:sensor histidine kinase [Acidobacteriota bacterium]